jgi:hypothetical protein
MVDRREGGEGRTFFSHYVTRRRKKKGLKGAGVETTMHGERERRKRQNVPEIHARGKTDFLTVDNVAVPKGALSNVAVRRIACGRMPPVTFYRGAVETHTPAQASQLIPATSPTEVESPDTKAPNKAVQTPVVIPSHVDPGEALNKDRINNRCDEVSHQQSMTQVLE